MITPVLMVQGGPSEGTAIPLAEGMNVIGRSPLDDIVVDHPVVSRQHAAICGGPEGYWILDLGSRNDTFVNGEPVSQQARRLHNFDRIELGGMETRWVFMESELTVEAPKELRA